MLSGERKLTWRAVRRTIETRARQRKVLATLAPAALAFRAMIAAATAAF